MHKKDAIVSQKVKRFCENKDKKISVFEDAAANKFYVVYPFVQDDYKH